MFKCVYVCICIHANLEDPETINSSNEDLCAQIIISDYQVSLKNNKTKQNRAHWKMADPRSLR